MEFEGNEINKCGNKRNGFDGLRLICQPFEEVQVQNCIKLLKPIGFVIQ